MITIDVDSVAAERRLRHLVDQTVSATPLLRGLQDDLQAYVDEVFASEGFGQWAPLAAVTVRSKNSGRILVDTGGLLDSLTGGGDISGETLTITTNEQSAGYLKAGARGMPKRNPLPEPPPATVNRWAEALLGDLVRRR